MNTQTPDRQAVDTCRCGCTVYRTLPEGDKYFVALCPVHQAAPDLLVTLKAAVKRIEIANEEGNPILSAWLPEACAAIAKAQEG